MNAPCTVVHHAPKCCVHQDTKKITDNLTCKDCVYASAFIMALHMYYIVLSMWRFLANRFGNKWFVVYEWCCRTEYQGRGSPHWHICAWVASFGMLSFLKGRTGTALVSAFCRFLELVFMCEIDVQVGNNRVNYISGYVSKDHDAVDVGLGEYRQKDATPSWLATYRLLCKGTPCMPEVAIRMAGLSEWEKSYSHVLLYPPQPEHMVEHEGRQGNFSAKMYGTYLQEKRQQLVSGHPIGESFLVWHRSRQWDAASQRMVFRGGKHNQTHGKTKVVACRYWYELTDGYWGQFAVTQLPHSHAKDLLPQEYKHLKSMQNFVGMLEYMATWRWSGPGVLEARDGIKFAETALPFLVDDMGKVQKLPYREGQHVFESDRQAFGYILEVAKRDLQYYGRKDERMTCFGYKQQANFLLMEKVRQCADDLEYERLRQHWDTVNRPKYVDFKWSPKQYEAIKLIDERLAYDDEEEKAQSKRFMYIAGAPGSGKSAVILEAAIRAARNGMRVLIVCPTGQLVHAFKSKLPEFDGVERIQVDTMHGVLKYKRPTDDKKVQHAGPSALRRIDLILVDEASQYDNPEWEEFYKQVKEQPHLPYTGVVADFKQLQPVSSGGLCQYVCETAKNFDRVSLDTVYRSSDEEHLLFLNRIREQQPERPVLREYFRGRHWAKQSMEECVAEGMRLGEETGELFTWLTCTNAGASEVCEAALRNLGISPSSLDDGYLCDPASKSDLRILARPGIVIRLTRNLDKSRGFVNGATAVVEYSLEGNAVFVARLVGTGNLVLVHPMYEDGATFLPCCYGYATTIRRAQGASLHHGCVYFDQKKHHAGRGYGYVAVSRFKTRGGVFLYGKLRRTDFLPVGEEKEDEVLERGWESLPSSDEERGIAQIYGDEDSDGDEGSDEEVYLGGASDDEEAERDEYLANLSDDGDEDAYLDEQPSGPCQSIIAADWE